jgi:hypothetical protein
LLRKALCRATGFCVSKLRLIAWRGVKSVIVQNAANAVPTEAPNSTTVIIISLTACYVHNNFDGLVSIDGEVVNCSDKYVAANQN